MRVVPSGNKSERLSSVNRITKTPTQSGQAHSNNSSAITVKFLEFISPFYGSDCSGLTTETVARRCSVKKVFLEIPQNSQENTCARDSFLINLQA